MDNIAEEIIEYIRTNYTPRKYILWGKRKAIAENTHLRDDLKLAFETAENLMDDFFNKWHVDKNGFDLYQYFHPECPGTSHIPDPHNALTVEMLVKSARTGKWLYK